MVERGIFQQEQTRFLGKVQVQLQPESDHRSSGVGELVPVLVPAHPLVKRGEPRRVPEQVPEEG